jgi:hypothetical protein
VRRAGRSDLPACRQGGRNLSRSKNSGVRARAPLEFLGSRKVFFGRQKEKGKNRTAGPFAFLLLPFALLGKLAWQLALRHSRIARRRVRRTRAGLTSSRSRWMLSRLKVEVFSRAARND